MENDIYQDKVLDTKKKIKNRKLFIIFLISLFVIICSLIGYFIIKKYYQNKNTISFNNYDVYQYFSNIKHKYNGILTYENGILTNVSDEGKKIDVSSAPIYFDSVDNECILPMTMGLFFINDKGKNYRVNYFSYLQTELSDNQEMAFISNDDKRVYVDNAFLYDGRDMYVFLYSTKIVIHGVEYELSPLSYVIVNYKDSVEIYDKKNDKYTIIDDVSEDVIGTMNNIQINLSTDMIMYENDNRLLIKNVNKLLKYEGEQ